MRALQRSLHRSRQFFASLRPRLDPALRDSAFQLLDERQRALFESMTLRDQQHCLDVYRLLCKEGFEDESLLTAALLHDSGKGRIALWHRVAHVLLDAAAPELLDRLTVEGDGPGWRQALYRCRHHPQLGAEAARRAGSSQRVAALIRGEDIEGELREPLAALLAADETV